MKRLFECSVCGSKEGKEIFSIKNYPAYLVPLPVDYAAKVIKADLPLYACSTCGHMQVPEPDQEVQKKIYEEYYNYYVVDSSEALISHYRKPFENFIAKLVHEKKIMNGNLLELGCSSGEKVEFFSSFSKSYTGIDPSHRIQLAAKKFPKHTFIQGYFPEALPPSLFDTIVTQFNLEHIEKVAEFISNIYKVSNENGMLIIQVPDAAHFERTAQPNFLAHEHIQYFTKETLSFLLLKNGFKPIYWGEEGPSLILAAVKTEPNAALDYSTNKLALQHAQKQALLFNTHPVLPEKPMIFYGVGPQLFWLLSQYNGNLNDIEVIDDNINYHQQGLPGYNKVIQPLSKKLVREKKYIVLSLNKIYHTQVLEKIRALNEPCEVLVNTQENKWNIINFSG